MEVFCIKTALAVIIASILCMFYTCNLIEYINNNDSQNIPNKLWLKIIICIIAALENALLYIKLGFGFEYIGYCILVIFITITALIDFYTHYVYEIITMPMLIFSVIFYVIELFTGEAHVESLIFILGSYIILKVLSKFQGIGAGDIDVFLISSLILSKCEILPVADIIFSMSISGLIGIFLIIFKKADLHYKKPLCPSIALATYILMLLI